MADLVPEHGGQLGLGVEVGQDPAGDVEESARYGERVDRRVVYDLEAPGQVGAFGHRRQLLPDAVQVGLQGRVFVYGHGLFDLL